MTRDQITRNHLLAMGLIADLPLRGNGKRPAHCVCKFFTCQCKPRRVFLVGGTLRSRGGKIGFQAVRGEG